MKQFDDVRLVAAYDDSEDRAAPVCADTGMKYTPHVEDVLGNPEVQAVIVGSEDQSPRRALCRGRRRPANTFSARSPWR